jgi:hypothetical protein
MKVSLFSRLYKFGPVAFYSLALYRAALGLIFPQTPLKHSTHGGFVKNYLPCVLHVQSILVSFHLSATGCTIGVLGFYSRRGLGVFLFITTSRAALGPAQPPIQWLPRALSLGVKRPSREANHSPPSSPEVKEWLELYIHSPIRLHGMVLS